MLRRHLPRAAALTLVAALASCGGDEPAATTPPLPATWANVQPLLQRACAFSSCHGGTGARAAGLTYGADAANARTAMVNVASTQVPRLRMVMPGDPSMSWLQHKIDGTMSTHSECSAAGNRCGVRMPQGSDPLTAAERDLIRRWIVAGAPG